jgi:hypothetical protein
MLGLIRGTTTAAGLNVDAVLDPTPDTKGIKVTHQEMAAFHIRRRRLCPELNDTIRPNKTGNS